MTRLMLGSLFAIVVALATSSIVEAKPTIGHVVEVETEATEELQMKAMKGEKLTEAEWSVLRKDGLIDKQGNWIGDYPSIANPGPEEGSSVDQGTVTPKKPKKIYGDYRDEIGTDPNAFIGGGAS